MKIKKIHVSAFGKLTNLTVDFTDGFNVLFGVNEAGKSTLMSFIRVMFYGFNSNARRNNLTDNDRERYRPWHSQLYGGTILFETGGRILRLERRFGATKAKDITRLANEATGQEIRLKLPDEPGSELFGLEKAEFLKTVFVQQMSSVITEDEGIKARLVSLIAGSDMQVSADQMKASLQEMRKKIVNDRRNSQSVTGDLLENKLRLEGELQTAYTQEQQRHDLTTRIGDLKHQIAEQEHLKKAADTRLEADRRFKAIEQDQEILRIWGRIEQTASDLDELRQPDAQGRVVPVAAVIETAGHLIEQVEQIDSRLVMLEKQAGDIRSNMADLPSPEELNQRLDWITEREETWQALEAAKLDLDAEEKRQVSQFDLNDRELDRQLNQAALDQATYRSTSETKLGELSAARKDAFFQKTTQEQTLRQKQDETLRRLSELAEKTAEDQGHLQDTAQQIEQESQILSVQKAQLARQQMLLSQMQQQAESHATVKSDSSAAVQPIWAIVGASLLLAGLAAQILGQPIWPWLVMLVGAALLAVHFLRHSSRQRADHAAEVAATLANQIQSQAFQVQSLEQQIDSQSLKLSHLERDMEQYRGRLSQDELEQIQIQAFTSGSVWETDMIRQLEAIDETVRQLDAEIDALKTSSAAESERLAKHLAEIQKEKDNHRFALTEAFVAQKNEYTASLSAWYEVIRSRGVETRDQLRSVKEDLLQKQATWQSWSGSLVSTQKQMQAEVDQRETLVTQLKQIGQGYFAESDIPGMKARLQLATDVNDRISQLSDRKIHLLETVQAGAGGKAKAETGNRIAENQRWMDEHAPSVARLSDAEVLQVRLSDAEVLQVRRDQAMIQETLQSGNMQLGRLTTQLTQLDQNSRLPVDIQREMLEIEEKLARCQSQVRSIDLAIEMISQADDEMRQTFGPIINNKTAEYLAGLTGLDHQTLRVANDFNVQVEDPVTHQFKAHDYFSNGKIDQIYLALRLAITDAVYTREGAENMPFAFDDILVQYDQQRGRQAVDFLVDISEKQERQMIMITCHDHIRQYGLARNCQVINLDQAAG